MAKMDRFIVLRDDNTAMRRGLPPMTMLPGFGPTALGRGEGRMTGRIEVPPQPRIDTVDLPSVEARSLERDPEVLEIARVMPTRLIEPREAPDGASDETGPTWGIRAVGADRSLSDGAGVRVAVLDTGIDAAHPAFSGVTLTQRDFTGDGDGDVNGHGTHCAGTIFGREVEGRRIGVAPGVTDALIGKVLGDDGSGSSEMLFESMHWAARAEARVISMSLGFDFPGFSERLVEENDLPVRLATSIALEAYRMNLRVFDRIMALFEAQADFTGGVVVVAASGNESERQIDPAFEVSASLPAAAEGVISVGALGRAEADALRVADFSNSNPVLSGPGVGVVSAATGGGLRSLNGTSMACPHVAGVAALWWQALRNAGVPQTYRSVEARMLASARRDVFAAGTDIADRGQGLAQAPLALVS